MRLKTVKPLVFLLLVLITSSCDKKTFSEPEEYLSYLNNTENGYLQEKSINGVKLSLFLKPTDLLVFQDVQQDSLSSDKINTLRENYNRFLYFDLSISKNGKDLLSVMPKDTDEFGGFVSHLSFNMSETIHLLNSTNDTLNTVNIIYPRMFGLSKKTTLFLIFEKDKTLLQTEYITLLIKDFGIGTGEVKFKIPAKLIKKQPSFDFK